MMHQLFLVAVHAFFIRPTHGDIEHANNLEVLLLQRANTGYMDGWWSVPAGHVDGNEDIFTAMQREISEEVGVRVIRSNKTDDIPQPHHIMHRRQTGEPHERIDFFYIFESWEGSISNCEPEKCSALAWYPLDGLPEKTIPYVRTAIKQALGDDHFSEFVEDD